MQPLVSVIIPSYNCADYVEEAVRSVLDQTYRNLEVIVVDDGSTDETPAVLAAIDDPRLIVVRTPNRGVSAARNEGLDRARGECIAFLDADDRWRPDKLERQVAILEAAPDLVAVFTDFVRFDGDADFRPGTQFDYFPELADLPTEPTVCGGRRILADAFAQLIAFTEWPTWLQTHLLRQDRIRDLRFVDAQDADGRFIFSEDGLFAFQAYRRGGVAYIGDPLVEVRRHARNMTKGATRHAIRKLGVLRALAREPLDPVQAAALRRRTGKELVRVARHHVEDGEFGAGLRALWEASLCGEVLGALRQAVRFVTPGRR